METFIYQTVEVLYKIITAVALRTIRCTNWAFGRTQDETKMRNFHPKIKLLISNAKDKIFNLSKTCSIVFDRTLIFSAIPTHRETQAILEKLYCFKENTSILTPSKKLKAANEAVAFCFRLDGINQEIERIKEQAISTRDVQTDTRSIKRNVLFTTTVAATVENIGEMVGEFIVNEEKAVIPKFCNPAVILGTKVCESIGRPIGKFVGTSLGLTGIYYLLEKLPLMQFEDRRKTIQAAAILLYLGSEYFQLNPLTNFIQDSCGQIGYNFAFYSIALLFNYIGMYMAGTGESLESYVRNMTPSTLVYEGANALFSKMGLEGITSGIVSYYLSHVAYNFEMYQSLYNGTLVDELLDSQTIGNVVGKLEVKSMRQALTAVMMQGLSINETAFFMREFGYFCERLQSQPLKSIIDEYKQELLVTMNRSCIEDLDGHQGPSRELQALNRRFYDALFGIFLGRGLGSSFAVGAQPFLDPSFSMGDYFPGEGVNPELSNIIELLWNPKIELPIDHEMLSKAVNQMINMQLESFYHPHTTPCENRSG